MTFCTPTTVLVTPTLSPKTRVAAYHTVSNTSKKHLTTPHTPKSHTVSKTPICPHAPQKSLTFQNGPPIKVEAIASDVFENALQVPALLTPPSVTVCAQSPITPTKPLRGLPYRAPSTWGPRRGAPVQLPKVEAEAVMARVDSFMSVPALTSLPVACGPQPGKFKMVRISKKASTVNNATPVKTRTEIPKPARITPLRTKAKAIKTPGAPRKNGKTATNLQAIEEIVRLEYCVLDVPSKSRSNGRAIRVTPIEDVVATEYVVVDSTEMVTPHEVSRMDVPQAPRKKVVSRNMRFVKKVGRLDFSRALGSE